MAMRMTQEEYDEKKKAYWISELNKLEVEPNGMAAYWAFRVRKGKEFDEAMKQQGVVVDN